MIINKTLSIHNLTFNGLLKHSKYDKFFESFNDINIKFKFGQSYCVDCEISEGGWALSWILSGYLKAEKGVIEIDGKKYSDKDLKKISWTVGISGREKYIKKSIRSLILKGLKKNKSDLSINEIKNMFGLSDERLDRTLDQLSGEKWRANMAIGFAHNMKIFSFPWIKPFILETYGCWFKDLLKILKENHCLVIIPSKCNDELKYIFDNVFEIKE